MYHFFVRVFAAAADSMHGRQLEISFDHALAALADLPNLFIEPDGSFVWTGSTPVRWQVDGNLVDRGDTLFYVELKGSCPPAALDQLLACLARTRTAFCFEWVQRGEWMDEAAFRRTAMQPH